MNGIPPALKAKCTNPDESKLGILETVLCSWTSVAADMFNWSLDSSFLNTPQCWGRWQGSSVLFEDLFWHIQQKFTMLRNPYLYFFSHSASCAKIFTRRSAFNSVFTTSLCVNITTSVGRWMMSEIKLNHTVCHPPGLHRATHRLHTHSQTWWNSWG